MCDIPNDLPWEVNWDEDFEDDMEDRKQSGSFENYKNQVLDIIENPVREGKYKSKDYKGLKTAHVSGQSQDIICFELTPGVNDKNIEDKIEEIYFHFIDHWDNYSSALTSRSPADIEHTFIVRIPYLAEGFDAGQVENDIYELASDHSNVNVQDSEWGDDFLIIIGEAEPSTQESLQEILPEAVEVEFNHPSPF